MYLGFYAASRVTPDYAVHENYDVATHIMSILSAILYGLVLLATIVQTCRFAAFKGKVMNRGVYLKFLTLTVVALFSIGTNI